LPLLHRNAVAGNSQSNWEDAAGSNSRNDAQCHERFEVRRETACKRGNADNKHADGDQPRLAEHIRKRTKHRLNECVGQGETGRKHRRRCRCYIQTFRDLRNDGIH
jgi:hypothetical protein